MLEKCFRDTRIQIGILRCRGMIIKNKSFAKRVIRETNYYNLINGYKTQFILQTTPNERYLPGTRFEELYALYEFDRKLRIITLEEILKIEKRVKTLVAYCFSDNHGHRDYLRFENFDIQGADKFLQVSKLLSDLYKKIDINKKDAAVSHYVNGKNYVPLWVLVNAISMGDISKFYSNMLPAERASVAKRMKWGVREQELSNILFYLSSVRNRCAHDELLYCYHSHVKMFQNRFYKYFLTAKKDGYFSTVVAFKFLLTAREYSEYQNKLDILFEELKSQLTTISIKKIRDIMDMPSNWKKIEML